MLDTRDKVVLVTGAGGGIGAAAAGLLHRRGARVVLLDVDELAVKEVAERLGEHALAVGADVRDRDATAQAIETATVHFGRLDVVVANAGVAPEPATVRTSQPAGFDRVVDVNLTGVFNTIRPALEQVIRNRGHVLVVLRCRLRTRPRTRVLHGQQGRRGTTGPGAAHRAGRDRRQRRGRVLRVRPHPFLRPIDDDPLGRRLDALLLWPFSQRITRRTRRGR